MIEPRLIAEIKDALLYPMSLRIAAKYVRNGGTEETWQKDVKNLSEIPDPILLQIQNDIRDIERGLRSLEKIPSI